MVEGGSWVGSVAGFGPLRTFEFSLLNAIGGFSRAGHCATLLSSGVGLRSTPPPLPRVAQRPTRLNWLPLWVFDAGTPTLSPAEGVGWPAERSKGGAAGTARRGGHERSRPPRGLGQQAAGTTNGNVRNGPKLANRGRSSNQPVGTV